MSLRAPLPDEEPNAFKCPNCGGRYYGSSFDKDLHYITGRMCHDQLGVGCRANGDANFGMMVDEPGPSLYEIEQALWQVYYHSRKGDVLDSFITAVRFETIDANDHPAIKGFAKALKDRWEEFPDATD